MHRVYAIWLHARCIPTTHAATKAVYVGDTAKPRHVRCTEHLTGHLAAGIVHRHGLRLARSLYRGSPSYLTRAGAQRGAKTLAQALRKQGYYVVEG